MPVSSSINSSVVHEQAPVEPVASPVEKAKKDVEKASKRVKCTAFTLIVLGLLGVVTSFVHGFGAREIASKIISRGSHHNQPAGDMDSEFMSRDEFALYDTFKTLSFISFVMSVLVLGIGKLGMRSAWR